MPKGRPVGDNARRIPYTRARLRAAQNDDRFKSRFSAAEVMGLSEDTVKRAELGLSIPTTETVALMIDAYDAPELADIYCNDHCPLACMRYYNDSKNTIVSAAGAITAYLDFTAHALDDGVINIDSQDAETTSRAMSKLISAFEDFETAYKSHLARKDGEDDDN